MPSDPYRTFLSVFYPMLFASSMISQTIVIYVIVFHSPKHIQNLRKILTYACVSQIILIIVTCTSQFRMISTDIPIELRVYGPCRFFPAWVGYALYQMLQTSAFISGMSIIITFYMKFEAVRSVELSSLRVVVVVFAFHIPILISVAMEITMVITQALPAEVRGKYELLNSNVDEYSVIGALSLKTVPSFINFLLISGSAVASPFVSLFLRNRILSRIDSHLDKSSQVKKTYNRVFVKGLTIQSVLPLVFYFPVFGLYFYCILTHAEVLFQQYFMTVVPALPAFFDPLLILYFVTPYRRRVKIWMRIEKESKLQPMFTSQINN